MSGESKLFSVFYDSSANQAEVIPAEKNRRTWGTYVGDFAGQDVRQILRGFAGDTLYAVSFDPATGEGYIETVNGLDGPYWESATFVADYKTLAEAELALNELSPNEH